MAAAQWLALIGGIEAAAGMAAAAAQRQSCGISRQAAWPSRMAKRISGGVSKYQRQRRETRKVKARGNNENNARKAWRRQMREWLSAAAGASAAARHGGSGVMAGGVCGAGGSGISENVALA